MTVSPSANVAPGGLSGPRLVPPPEAKHEAMRRARKISLVLVAAVLVLHLLPLGSSLPWWQRLLGAVPGVFAVHLGWLYLAGRERRLPFLAFTVTAFYVSWGLPTVTYEAAECAPIKSEAMTEALLAITALVGFVLLAYPFGCQVGRRLAPTIDRILPRSPGGGVSLLLPFWFVALVFTSSGALARTPMEVRQVLAVVFGSCCPLLAYLYLRSASGPHAKPGRIATAGVIGIVSIAGLSTGFIGHAIYPVVVGGLLAVTVWRVVPWRLALVFVALVGVFQPVKGVYRSLAWEKESVGLQDESLGLEGKLEAWTIAFSRVWLEDSSEVNKTKAIAGRLNTLCLIATSFELTPGIIPHDLGAQWKRIPLTLVPRALYPGKPNLTVDYNDRFNITFGYQTKAATETSTNSFPLVVDGYWNFGWLGVVFVGAVVGVLIGVLTTGIPIGSWGGLAIAVAALLAVNAEGHFAGLLAAEAQAVVGIGIACWMVRALSVLPGLSKTDAGERHGASER